MVLLGFGGGTGIDVNLRVAIYKYRKYDIMVTIEKIGKGHTHNVCPLCGEEIRKGKTSDRIEADSALVSHYRRQGHESAHRERNALSAPIQNTKNLTSPCWPAMRLRCERCSFSYQSRPRLRVATVTCAVVSINSR